MNLAERVQNIGRALSVGSCAYSIFLPKYQVSQAVGFIKGKSAIAIARNYMGVGKKLHRTKFLGERGITFQR